ncbi:hypothetical protein BGW38_000737, partial [Lunasporangiospora selenospora]
MTLRRRRSASPTVASLSFSLSLASLFVLGTTLILPTHGQNTPPIITGSLAYTQANGRFYIHGGERSTTDVSSQLYALDLTRSWTADAPAWTSLAASPFSNSYHVMTHSFDNKFLYLFGRNTGTPKAPPQFINKYSVDTDTWDAGVTPAAISTPDRRDFQGAFNPATGDYMFLGGNYGNLGATTSNALNIFYTKTGSVNEAAIPFPDLAYLQGGAVGYVGKGPGSPGLAVFAGSWSSNGTVTGKSKTLVNPGTPRINSNGAWSQLTLAAAPAGRMYPCVASNTDGSKVVMYGGFNSET